MARQTKRSESVSSRGRKATTVVKRRGDTPALAKEETAAAAGGSGSGEYIGVQKIVAPGGAELAVLPWSDYEEMIEDAGDAALIRASRARIEAGEEETLPAKMARRLIAGESAVRVWREHRGLTQKALAESANLSVSAVSQIENGIRKGSVDGLKAIAAALDLTIDDLV